MQRELFIKQKHCVIGASAPLSELDESFRIDTGVKMNSLQQLHTYGQSPYLDDLRRNLVASGELKRLIDDGVRGLTSNPAIFEKAIAQSNDYDEAIRELVKQGKNVEEIYRTLTVEDVQGAADLFRPLYDGTGGNDGFVSYEVSPELATDTEATLAEARELWKLIGRPNAMIKVPATQEGLPVIQQLISEGVNVNVTLIFGLPRYELVAKAYLAGLRERAGRGESVAGIASVASFFLSRIDILIDDELKVLTKNGNRQAESLKGEVAVASAKVAYEVYKKLFSTTEFGQLAGQGAKPQRLLWASTGVKNPAYAADKYVEPLVGENTVTSMPQKTLDAYREHGAPSATLEKNLEKAHDVLTQLETLGISIDEATQKLEDEGVEKFVTPFNSLMQTLGKARDEAAKQV